MAEARSAREEVGGRERTERMPSKEWRTIWIIFDDFELDKVGELDKFEEFDELGEFKREGGFRGGRGREREAVDIFSALVGGVGVDRRWGVEWLLTPLWLVFTEA